MFFKFIFVEFLSYGFGYLLYCGINCKFLLDGFGYWINGMWVFYVLGKKILICSGNGKLVFVLNLKKLRFVLMKM